MKGAQHQAIKAPNLSLAILSGSLAGIKDLDPAEIWQTRTNFETGFTICFIEGSLEVKLPTIWTDEKQSREEAEKRKIRKKSRRETKE